MNLGLVVEGPSDAASYPELISKIRQDLITVQIRPCGGKSKLEATFTLFLEEFHRNHAWQITRALVIRDSDCKPSLDIENRLGGKLQARRFPGLDVHFFATKCDLETWLVADEDAINLVSRQRGQNKTISPLSIQLEVKSAKPHFFEQLWKAGLQPVGETYRQVARSMDTSRVLNRCPSFRRFAEMLRAW